MAFQKITASVAAPKFVYTVKLTGFLAGTYRTEGDTVRMTERAAEHFVRTYQIELKADADARVAAEKEAAAAAERQKAADERAAIAKQTDNDVEVKAADEAVKEAAAKAEEATKALDAVKAPAASESAASEAATPAQAASGFGSFSSQHA